MFHRLLLVKSWRCGVCCLRVNEKKPGKLMKQRRWASEPPPRVADEEWKEKETEK